MRRAAAIKLSEDDRRELERLARRRTTEVRLAERARIVLLAAAGRKNVEIAAEIGLGRVAVGVWRVRFAAGGLPAIRKDLPRGGRRPAKIVAEAPRVLHATMHEAPPAATHWSVRTMAKHLAVSRSMVERVWKAHGLRPHLVRTFKASNDPRFEEKTIDVVGLYLDPPEKALVLSVDEKSQIQALDRTQPGLPMVRGRAGTMTHDYKRNGTTTLFAAVDVASGAVIGQCMARHRHQEFLAFLKHIDASTDPTLALHLIVDNYATHKHPNVKKWLDKHRRFHLHFTPTSSSWLNLIERWFRNITTARIRRGVFRSVKELVAAIEEYIEHHNDHAKGFDWRATAEQIIAKYRRARATLQKIATA